MSDTRGRKVVFLSHCLLDQNVRFPGIAVAPGCASPLVESLAHSGIGIEQMPCPESRYWGGVRRRLVMPFLKHAPRLLRHGWTPALSFGLKVATTTFSLMCRAEALAVYHRAKALELSGHRVAGFIVMNDSPTCGLDRTIDLGQFMTAAADRGPEIDWSDPEHDKMRELIAALLEPGSGFFARALRETVSGGKMKEAKFLGFDPWADPEAETHRILAELEGI